MVEKGKFWREKKSIGQNYTILEGVDFHFLGDIDIGPQFAKYMQK